MPVVSVRAKARIATIFMAITPLQGCLDFGAGGDRTPNRDCNRRKISDEKRCHRHLQHYSPAQFVTVPQEQEKSCALCHNRDWGRSRIIPDPTANANLYVEVPLIPTAGPRPTLSVLRSPLLGDARFAGASSSAERPMRPRRAGLIDVILTIGFSPTCASAVAQRSCIVRTCAVWNA